jgi:hypothetical protein
VTPRENAHFQQNAEYNLSDITGLSTFMFEMANLRNNVRLSKTK